MIGLDNIRSAGEQLFQEFSRQEYRRKAGLHEGGTLKELYARYETLLESETIDFLRSQPGEKGIQFLLEFLIEHLIERETFFLKDDLADLEKGATVDLYGEFIPFRWATGRMMVEKEREKREILERGMREIMGRMVPTQEKIFSALHDLAMRLKFSGYGTLREEISPGGLKGLLEITRKFVKETEGLYQEVLAWVLKKRGSIEMGKAKRFDLLYALYDPDFDRYFPRIKMAPFLTETFQEMGIDIKVDGRIIFDEEGREQTSSQPFCAPLQVPSRMILTIPPLGGERHYRRVLHELGRALSYATRSPDKPFEYRCLGDRALLEGYALSFEFLPLQREWARRVLRLGYQTDDYLRLAYIQHLFFLRRLGAKLEYELSVYEEKSLEGKDEIYQEILTTICRVEYPKELYLYDLDDRISASKQFKAAIFQAQLFHFLREEYDEDWFRSGGAGEFLKDLWTRGGEMTLEEGAHSLGFHEFDLTPLLKSFEEYL